MLASEISGLGNCLVLICVEFERSDTVLLSIVLRFKDYYLWLFVKAVLFFLPIDYYQNSEE